LSEWKPQKTVKTKKAAFKMMKAVFHSVPSQSVVIASKRPRPARSTGLSKQENGKTLNLKKHSQICPYGGYNGTFDVIRPRHSMKN
jgi:hypothetical protein